MVTLSNERHIRDAQRTVLNACKILYNEGLWELFGEGHPSLRIPGTELIVMPGHVHPFGRGLGDIHSVKDLLLLDLDGKVLRGKLEPMESVQLHCSIYKAREDVNGIVYVHPPYCDTLASAGKSIHLTSISVPKEMREIPVYFTGGEVTTPEIAKGLISALGKRNSILLRSVHSLITVGVSLEQAVTLAYVIEKIAKRQYQAMTIGGMLPEGEFVDHRTGKEDTRLTTHVEKVPFLYVWLERRWSKRTSS